MYASTEQEQEQGTYIYIHTHGNAEPTDPIEGNQTAIMISSLPGINIQKFTIAHPGTLGMETGVELAAITQALEENTNMQPDMANYILDEAYKSSIKIRRKKDYIHHINPENVTPARDVSMTTTTWNRIEPINGYFFLKNYMVIEGDGSYSFKGIEILNGPFKGQNILDFDFLITYSPELLQKKSDFIKIINGKKMLTLINTIELFRLLRNIGLFNVYIIDPTCSNNCRDNTISANRLMAKKSVKTEKNLNTGQHKGKIYNIKGGKYTNNITKILRKRKRKKINQKEKKLI